MYIYILFFFKLHITESLIEHFTSFSTSINIDLFVFQYVRFSVLTFRHVLSELRAVTSKASMRNDFHADKGIC